MPVHNLPKVRNRIDDGITHPSHERPSQLAGLSNSKRRPHVAGLLDAVNDRDYGARAVDASDELVAPGDKAAHTATTEILSPIGDLPQIPGFETRECIGRGGMGVVYRAHDVRLDRTVALKLLPLNFARRAGRLKRFQREARMASALNHPAICTVYDVGSHNGLPFIVMEFVNGRTLRELVNERTSVEYVVRLFHQAARALEAAHAAGIVHRDVKPENLMVRNDGYVKVLDFGLARRLTERQQPDQTFETKEGAVIGTRRYMSPEQARGERVGSAGDIFSLGVSLFELATGEYPFPENSCCGALDAVNFSPDPSASRPRSDIPASLDALILQMLNPSARLRPTAAEVANVLDDLLKERCALGERTQLAARRLVGRQQERNELRAAWASASAGSGLLACVTGEPGLGKTTLVEEFLAELEGEEPLCIVARGRCSQRLAGAEAYLAVLELLESLIRGPQGDLAKRLLKTVAPSWYAQVTPAPDTPDVRPDGASSAERLKREFVNFFQELCRQRVVALFVDDLHWSDVAAADLLAYLGGRLADLRLLVIATYRPMEMALEEHPFLTAKQELVGKALCRDIGLSCLSHGEIGELVSAEFPGRLPAGFDAEIYARTEGIPLFAADMLRYLRERGLLVSVAGGWECARPLAGFKCELPRSVQGMIKAKLAQLSKEDRRLLEAASVQGVEFDLSIASQVIDMDVVDADERLHALHHVHALIRPLRLGTLPDGRQTIRYAFVHALYQNALYDALAPLRKHTWSSQTAQALLEQFGDHHAHAAAQLALLYEAAGEPARAAEHFRTAARNATDKFAYREAAALATRGLEQLQHLPESPDRCACEFRLQLALGKASQPTSGFGSTATGVAYRRAVDLSAQVGSAVERFHALWGLWFFHVVRLDLIVARRMAEELLRLASAGEEQDFVPYAHRALQMTLAHQGEFAAAQRHFQVVLPWLEAHPPIVVLNGDFEADPGIPCLAYAGWTSWPLGFPDVALRHVEQAIDRARNIAHPQSLCTALYFAAILHQRRGDVARTHDAVEELIALGEADFAAWAAWAAVFRGWVQFARGDRDTGIAQMRQALAGLEVMETGTGKQRGYCLLAGALVEAGQTAEAQSLVDQALATLERTGEFAFESDVYRTQGNVLSRQCPTQAEAWYRRAVDAARRQQAKSVELQAVTRLSRLLIEQGRDGEARHMLQLCFCWFNEGLDTADLQEAAALLQELRSIDQVDEDAEAQPSALRLG